MNKRALILYFALTLIPVTAGAQAITAVSFDNTTVVQFGSQPAPAGSDLWLMTQADDGELYAAWGDGTGWDGANYQPIGITRMTGTPPSLNGTDIYGTNTSDWKPSAIIADQNQVMKMFVNRSEDNWNVYYGASSTNRGTSWSYTSAGIYSSSADTVVPVGFVQFGAAYASVPAGVDAAYYYVYLNARSETNGPHFYLMRALKSNIFTRTNHEYFAGLSGGNPTWTSTFANKVPVLTDSDGMDASGSFQVNYNPGLARFIGLKASNTTTLGMYDAATPWGPFHQIYHQQFLNSLHKFAYVTPTKWMSASGLNFWLAWSGYPEYDNVNLIRGTFTTSATLPPPPSGVISNVLVASGKNYPQFTLSSGSVMYTDRAYTFGTIPGALSGQTAIRTANDDKLASPTSLAVSFTLNQASTVYVLYTNVNSAIDSTWLTAANGWQQDSFIVPTTLAGTEANRLIRHKFFAQNSTVSLLGNGGLSQTSSMYTVVIVPDAAASPCVQNPLAVSVSANPTYTASQTISSLAMVFTDGRGCIATVNE